MGRRRVMYLMSYATNNDKTEKFVFYKAGNELGVRVNGKRAT